jgi:hypothetical protein
MRKGIRRHRKIAKKMLRMPKLLKSAYIPSSLLLRDEESLRESRSRDVCIGEPRSSDIPPLAQNALPIIQRAPKRKVGRVAAKYQAVVANASAAKS